MQNEEPAAMPAEEDQPEWIRAQAGGIRVTFGESEANAADMKGKVEEIKARIAEKVRGDSRERSALTPDDIIVELDDDLRFGRIDGSAVLDEMASDDRYVDIKSITTATGLLFLHSDMYIAADAAVAKSLVEEAKFMLASAIRTDSSQKVKLTPAGDIYAMAPDADPKLIDVVLNGMRTEERYADIKAVTSPSGDVYYHSDKYLVDRYAATLVKAMAGDHCATIADTVREESKIYPRTTNARTFHKQELFGMPPEDLETIIDDLMRKPEYSDIKKIIHPATGAVHLYSDRYITEATALVMMDWEEVGRDNNP